MVFLLFQGDQGIRRLYGHQLAAMHTERVKVEMQFGVAHDDVYYPQKALTTRTRTEHTDIHHGHPTPLRTHAHLRSRYTTGQAIKELHLPPERGGGLCGPAAKARGTSGRDRPPRYGQGKTFHATSCPHPQTPSTSIIRVCAPAQKKSKKQKKRSLCLAE